ncbi:mitochondrial import receptor subunit TOM40 homolog 1 [Osmia lignaria lignaria]|uniref:mitochondrial import receptor subunit TOM40 homolog 1 n=1 Tax=Osmia lignaria lignaria TaxID=1437193 RepID=UPI0014795D8F|nr:mitochondrial import receptor subunit TOM40 homolog 1 [Osmia lignaria]XP_034186143.1 mitochondrial import receptor subunit TOM40 homolog 1 [Osmia lignaria]XP_034186145.1 mitochondrial import receptor subunit TOM40 homolog 1 [Osmia lignaria]XP_034186146.1 mitochondrial import receptor subunit TOM40 homolog 1 [Osmia lignaria]
MGNVLAASVPPPPSPPPPTSGLLPNLEKPDLSTGLHPSTKSSDSLSNPGTIEDLHKKCKDVFPVNFEGAKLMFNKGLSNHFQISHTINMSSVAPSGYRFGATYVGTQEPVPSEAYPVLLGDIDPSGNLNANIIHQFGQRIRGKLATQVQKSKFTAVQMTTDYRGDAYTLSFTVGNPDILNGSGVFVMHYLQSITPSIALGGELAYQRGPAIPGGQVAVLSAAGRYTCDDSTISASLGFSGCHLCFHQRASPQLQVGVELEINSRIQESTGTIAYQVDLPKADLIFRGSVDTNWTVGAVLEKKLQPLPFSFALSGMMNHSKQQFRLGCGLIIG